MVFSHVIKFVWLLCFSNSPYYAKAACCSLHDGCSRENTTAPQLCGTDSFQLTSNRSEIHLFCNYEGDLDDLSQVGKMRWQIHAPNGPSENLLYFAGSAYSPLSDEAKWFEDSRPGGFVGQANRTAIKTEFGVYTSLAVRRTAFSTAGLWAFSCEIALTDSSVRYNYTVDILDPQPRMLGNATEQQVARVGERVELQCTIKDLGTTDVQWTKYNTGAGAELYGEFLFIGNLKVTDNSRLSKSFVHSCVESSLCEAYNGVPDSSTGTTTLHIDNVQPGDAGLYQCQAILQPPPRREITLIVEEQPTGESDPPLVDMAPDPSSISPTAGLSNTVENREGQPSNENALPTNSAGVTEERPAEDRRVAETSPRNVRLTSAPSLEATTPLTVGNGSNRADDEPATTSSAITITSSQSAAEQSPNGESASTQQLTTLGTIAQIASTASPDTSVNIPVTQRPAISGTNQATLRLFSLQCYTCQDIKNCFVDDAQTKTCPDGVCWTNQQTDSNGFATTRRGCSADVWPTGPNAPPREGCVNNYKTKKCYVDDEQEDCLVCCQEDRCNNEPRVEENEEIAEQLGDGARFNTVTPILGAAICLSAFCSWAFQDRL